MGYKLELICAIEAILWGTWLLVPWDMFSASKTFRFMNTIAPEWVWGLTVCLLGVCQLCGLLVKSYKTRRLAAVLSIFTWTLVSIAVIAGNYQSTATIIYPVFVVMSILIYSETTLWKKLEGKL